MNPLYPAPTNQPAGIAKPLNVCLAQGLPLGSLTAPDGYQRENKHSLSTGAGQAQSPCRGRGQVSERILPVGWWAGVLHGGGSLGTGP